MENENQSLYDKEQILEPMTKEQLDPQNWKPCSEMKFIDFPEEAPVAKPEPYWFKSERLF